MHDFFLAKEIMEKLSEIAMRKNISHVKKVYIEIGSIALAHDGYPEHTEDISVENLEFGLKSLAQKKPFKSTRFFIRKVAGDNWKIVDIEV